MRQTGIHWLIPQCLQLGWAEARSLKLHLCWVARAKELLAPSSTAVQFYKPIALVFIFTCLKEQRREIFPSIGSVFKCLWWPGLSQVHTRRQKFRWGLWQRQQRPKHLDTMGLFFSHKKLVICCVMLFTFRSVVFCCLSEENNIKKIKYITFVCKQYLN